MINALKKRLVQDVIYWTSPTPDGFGGFTFGAPVNLKCRWEDKRTIKQGDKGNEPGEEYVYKSTVNILEAVEENGYLMLGKVVDLSDTGVNPETLPEAYKIKAVDKTTAVGGRVNWQTIYL